MVEHCSKVLEFQPDNVKALFRRGKAYAEIGEGENARKDLRRSAELDAPLSAAVDKALNLLAEKEKSQIRKDKEVYSNMFASKALN